MLYDDDDIYIYYCFVLFYVVLYLKVFNYVILFILDYIRVGMGRSC